MPRDLIREALALAGSSGQPFHVQLAGGEPTLEPGLVEFTARTLRLAALPATLSLQTNATLLDRPLIECCRRYRIGLGVSLDGPPEVQERLRGGSGATFRGLARLEAAGMAFRVTTVLCAASAPCLGDLVLALAPFSMARSLGLDPVVRRGRAARPMEKTDPGDPAWVAPASAREVAEGVRVLLARLGQVNRVRPASLRLRELDAVRAALSGSAPGDFCHACRGESLAVHPDGRVFPCGQAMGDPELAAGTLGRIDWPKLQRAFAGARLQGPCADCPLAGRCPGDCPSRLASVDPIESDQAQSVQPPPAQARPSPACAIYRTLAAHCLQTPAPSPEKA
jgi:uncharacterized protein